MAQEGNVGKYTRSAMAIFLAIAVAAVAACQKNEVSNGSNGSNAAANKAAANTSSASNSAAAPSNTEIDLSTPTAAYKTAYNARNNKDIPALKRVLSKDVQDFLTEMGKEDDGGGKSIDDMLRELTQQPQAPSAEARNEKINGDRATIEYLDEKGAWHPMDFVKENGEWKMSIGEPNPGTDAKPQDTDKGKNKK